MRIHLEQDGVIRIGFKMILILTDWYKNDKYCLVTRQNDCDQYDQTLKSNKYTFELDQLQQFLAVY